MARFDSYIICATARSGSTLLCSLLSATGNSGNPQSYFHRPSIEAWAKAMDLPVDAQSDEIVQLSDIMNAVLSEGTSDTGIFGLRLMRSSFDYLMAQLDRLHPNLPNDTARFEAAFGRTAHVHLTRRDKLAQAVSLAMAEQSGLWHRAADGTELERSAPAKDPCYDKDQIAGHLADVRQLDADWEDWFGAENVDPICLSYEGLAADPTGTLRHLLDQLGLDSKAAKGILPGVMKLAGAENLVWADLFCAQAGEDGA